MNEPPDERMAPTTESHYYSELNCKIKRATFFPKSTIDDCGATLCLWVFSYVPFSNVIWCSHTHNAFNLQIVQTHSNRSISKFAILQIYSIQCAFACTNTWSRASVVPLIVHTVSGLRVLSIFVDIVQNDISSTIWISICSMLDRSQFNPYITCASCMIALTLGLVHWTLRAMYILHMHTIRVVVCERFT